ncbi:hypothetical protein [Massilia sp. 9096]|uniref:hypothetical protein n=1 Tax=Massilia sp. 9096 TaxID=1500894 RepID=UPI00055B6F53|nr:hypothetical protein [Massilia sp. 9096]
MSLLSACGGGGGGSAPDAVASSVTPVALPAGSDVAVLGAPGSAGPLVVPSPPDMSIAPPPGTVVAPAAPDLSANAVSAGATMAASAAAPASALTLGDPVAVDLPEGATACQPSTCPAFAVNGSVTNTQGADDPSAAHGYLLPPDGLASGGYPDFGNLPTMILPSVAVTVGEALNAPD